LVLPALSAFCVFKNGFFTNFQRVKKTPKKTE